MTDTVALTRELTALYGPSGNEDSVRDYILQKISPYCDAKVDKMGNIIAFKKGKNRPYKKVMVDAHMDEVGFIITGVTDSGLLRFETVGGIDAGALISEKVVINGNVGVIGMKAIHLASKEERDKMPKADSLFIDIGATDREDALSLVSLGDIGTFINKTADLGDDLFISKAIDDRFGCGALITLLLEDSEYDFYATFTVGEELGLRGARTAAYTLDPDYAVVLEATTAADIYGTPDEKKVCEVGKGGVISFMDRSTLYNRDLFNLAINTAKEKGIPAQIKKAVAGGNNAGAIHLTRKGVPTITLSLPCRYIHSPSSLASKRDINAVTDLARELIAKLAGEQVK